MNQLPLRRRPLQVALLNLWRDIVALVLPSDCVGCGRNDRVLCNGCQRELASLARDPPVTITNLQLPSTGIAKLAVVSACEYDGLVRRLITAIKHSDQPGLAKYLGPLLAATIDPAIGAAPHADHPSGGPGHPPSDPPPIVFVPVPSRARRERERGYRHVELLLRHAGVPRYAISRAVVTARGRGPQVGQDIASRHKNAAKLRIRSREVRWLRDTDATVMIVDDITTTGASIIAVYQALTRAGIDANAAVVVARVPRHE